MFAPDLPSRISARALHAGHPIPTSLAASLALYLDTLRRWNRRINLTSLPLDPATDDALDRLVVEPLLAVSRVRVTDRLVLDIGSGGGSPALPLKLAVPRLRMVLVEARARKSAFLREAVRTLGLSDVQVATGRLSRSWVPSELEGAADLVTVRAVKVDGELWSGIRTVTRPGARVLWFGNVDIAPNGLPDWLRPGAEGREDRAVGVFDVR